jgi:valyl-tRNA synthetase
VYVSEEKFEVGRNFGTKIWNAARFIQMHKTQNPIDVRAIKLNPDRWSPDDWHIVAKVEDAAKAAQDCLERCRFNDYALVLYDFFWAEFCDWYVEYSKDVLYGQDEARREEVLKIMHHVLDRALRLLHPLMPFLTEELWHGMGYGAEDETIQRAPWPEAKDATLRGMADTHVQYVDQKHELIRLARNLKADADISTAKKCEFVIRPLSADIGKQLESDRASLMAMVRAEKLTIDPAFNPAKAMPSALGVLGTVYLSLEGLVDVAAETAKLRGQVEKLDKELAGISAKLDNPNFVQKAKPEVVELQQAKRKELVEKREKLVKLIEALSAQPA